MISIIIPANNEAAHIGACLSAVLASDGPAEAQIVVAANGCDDETVAIAQGFQATTQSRGWSLTVLDMPAVGKMGALNAGDTAARWPMRAYLDADVLVDADLMAQIAGTLDTEAPRYASGQLRLARAQSWATRAYGRIYARVPFVTNGVPGAGLFAVNAAGRARWGAFPEIISDDTFVRLSFAPEERVGVAAGYDWPLVEGFGPLVRVRRRQNAGVDELNRLYPALQANDDKVGLGPAGVLGLAVRDPVGFLVYAGVALIVKLSPNRGSGWERGR
ncbi:glycosyltransferase [Shimia abyssi]|uniref:Glycosyl transferase family 2 n=1 Tax=Shimia abyssi TaxID=1662395 RepID=A0A2P8FBR9_9RHOB|nr:glycosyltransferase [Shimia abyssi]PSL19163.1 glycosyl transferase family 2 [Shimia abyssi]